MKTLHVKNLVFSFLSRITKVKSLALTPFSLTPLLFLALSVSSVKAEPLCSAVFSNAAGTTSGSLNANSGAKLFYTETNANTLSVGSITGTSLICEGGTVNCTATSYAPTMTIPNSPLTVSNTDLNINSGSTQTFSSDTTRKTASISGILNLNGDIYLNIKNNGSQSKNFTMNWGSVLNINGNVTIYADNFSLSGTINILSGSLTLIGNGNVNINNGTTTNTNGSYDKLVILNRGNLDVNANINAIIYSVGNANINSGGTVRGALTAGSIQLNGAVYYYKSAIESAVVPGCVNQQCNSYNGILDPLEFEGKTFQIIDTYKKVEFTKVKFANPFSSPPAVFILPTKNGTNTANIRLKNITRLGFEVTMTEPVGEDGAHVAMNVNYFAINYGVHKLGNTIIEVGGMNTKKVKPLSGINQGETYGWDELTSKAVFCNPALVSTIQTMNNEPNYIANKPSKPFLVPAIEIEGKDINISLDKVPTSSNAEVKVDETIAYMIAEGNIQDNFIDSNNKAIAFETIKTAPLFVGWGNGDKNVSFVNKYTTTPLVAATKVSNYEEEPAWFRSQSINKSQISLTLDESNDWPSNNERKHAPEEGSIFAFSGEFYIFTGVCQYIKSKYQTTQDGYYYVDEGTANIFGLKPFEVYCSNMNSDAAIAYLPTVINQNNSQNSNFKFNSISSNNYYHSSNSKTFFDKIRIDNYFFAHADFLNQGFSNINLVGTSFKVDLSNTVLTTCDGAADVNKLRLGHYLQAIKLDPKVDTKQYCGATQMKFTQLPGYYAKDSYKNMTTCAEVATSSSTKPPSGYYLLKKPRQLTGQSQYVVAYCEMNPTTTNQIWTMFVALDGETTKEKSDVVNGNDTCARIGYSFFTPNHKDVMTAARNFLTLTKTEWQDYTGTVREYFNDHGIGGWATDTQSSYLKPNPIPDGAMWPYGPFGIYKSSSGASGNDKKMAISKQFIDAIDKNDSFGSLDETGWKSVLKDIHKDYNDTWWVADMAAGYKRDSNGHLIRMADTPVEPNGDYDANNWLGWFADANGNIVHYNDQSGGSRYSYSNYICMSADMYVFVDKKWDAWKFDAWDQGDLQKRIKTKLAGRDFIITIGSLDDANLPQDFNGTVCVKILDDANNSLNGDGTKVYFNGTKEEATLPINIAKAIKVSKVGMAWKEQVNEACPLYDESNSTVDNDYFALRPSTFQKISPVTMPKAGKDFNLTFQAMGNSNSTISGYDATVALSKSLTDKSKSATCQVLDGNLTLSNGNQITTLVFTSAQSSGRNQVRFNDVGNFTLGLKDTLWTAVDQPNDCVMDSNSTVLVGGKFGCNIENNVSLSIVPHHFKVEASLYNNNKGLFTYLSEDLNMSAYLDVNITAQTEQNTTTKNYDVDCYAKQTTHRIDFNTSSIAPSANLNYLKYQRENDISIINTLLSSHFFTLVLDASLFNNTSSGEAKVGYKINFDRNSSKPVSPFDLNITTVRVLDTDGVDGNDTTVGSAKFYYGRIKTKDITTDKTTVPHLLHVEVFSTTPLSGFYQNSLNWYTNPFDANVTKITDINLGAYKDFTQTLPTPVLVLNKNGFNNGVLSFDISNPNKLQGATFHLAIPSWLWYSSLVGKDYNATGNCSYHPCFEYKYLENASGKKGIASGDYKGSTVGADYNSSYQKTGVKTFR
jgi:hypothetical protein